MENIILKPIKTTQDIDRLIEAGYTVVGPRNDFEKDLKTFKIFLEKGKEFAPEDWLKHEGYRMVAPNQFTNGFWIAFKMVNDFPDERFNSNYFLKKDDTLIKLYLQKEMPKLD